jgi:hypothetical protein
MTYASTYGEILPSGMSIVINDLNEMNQFTNDDVMYDLGCGVGKIVCQFAYETICKKCIGIELGITRHQKSIIALDSMKNAQLNNVNKIQFIHGNILEQTQWCNDGTILFINAICFPEEVWIKLEKLIEQNVDKFKTIFLFGPLFDSIIIYDNYDFALLNVPATWCDSVDMARYTKKK